MIRQPLRGGILGSRASKSLEKRRKRYRRTRCSPGEAGARTSSIQSISTMPLTVGVERVPLMPIPSTVNDANRTVNGGVKPRSAVSVRSVHPPARSTD